MPYNSVGGNNQSPKQNGAASQRSKLREMLPTIDIEFENVSYIVPKGRKKAPLHILNDVSGKFRSGRLTAIMGPSGAGKTTLMNIISAYKISHVEGDIKMNGVKRSNRRFRKSSCYIMQEDHHLPHLTVLEAMTISVNLKLGDKTTSEKQNIISEILRKLSLEECRKTRTMNLSGGQKKRLSIAVELVDNPPVMFFDEPTSGLDSQNSFQCISLLKTLATEDGRTIVCTIHQPSARLFEQFDYLYALAEGHCIYRGAVNGLLGFLSALDFKCPPFHNPADFLIEVVATGEDSTNKLSNAVKNGSCNNIVLEIDTPDLCKLNDTNTNSLQNNPLSANGASNSESSPFICKNGNQLNIQMSSQPRDTSLFTRQWSEDLKNFFPTSGFRQFWILLKRNYVSIIRDSMLTKLRLISHLVVGLLIGALYFDIGNEASKVYSNTGFLFCSVLFTVFAGMMPTLLTFPLEMKVFLREHHNCWYSLKAYYTAKTMADIPFQIFYPVLFTSIVYFMTSQPLEVSRFFMFATICVLTSFVAQSLALVIGAAMEIQEATFFAPVVSIPILLFSGFFVTYSTIPKYLRWVTFLSYMRYGFEGIILSVYGFERENLECSRAFCLYKSPTKYLEEMDIFGTYWIDALALCGFFLILRIIGYFVLRWKLKSER